MINLKESLELVKDRPNFYVKHQDGVFIINYYYTVADTFDDAKINFRGITFDEQTGELLSLPLHKFFNVNEKEFTLWDNIKNSKATVYEKYDGSLIHFYKKDGELKCATRGGDTNQSRAAKKLLSKSEIKNIEIIIDNGYTPMFEYIGPENKVVVDYSHSELVYLCSRNRQTGEYLTGNKIDINLSEVPSSLSSFINREGFVCILENGLWVKFKSDWYLKQHKVYDIWSQPEWKKYGLVLDELMNDIIAATTDKRKEHLLGVKDRVEKDRGNLLNLIYQTYMLIVNNKLVDKTDRKSFALISKYEFPDIFSPLMMIYTNKSPIEWINKSLLEKYKKEFSGFSNPIFSHFSESL